MSRPALFWVLGLIFRWLLPGVAALASGLALAQGAVPYRCEGRAEIVGACFEVRGRLSFWNGAPSARIWRVGTRRVLGIHNDELPPKLAEVIDQAGAGDAKSGTGSFAGSKPELWGTFRVCPYT